MEPGFCGIDFGKTFLDLRNIHSASNRLLAGNCARLCAGYGARTIAAAGSVHRGPSWVRDTERGLASRASRGTEGSLEEGTFEMSL